MMRHPFCRMVEDGFPEWTTKDCSQNTETPSGASAGAWRGLYEEILANAALMHMSNAAAAPAPKEEEAAAQPVPLNFWRRHSAPALHGKTLE